MGNPVFVEQEYSTPKQRISAALASSRDDSQLRMRLMQSAMPRSTTRFPVYDTSTNDIHQTNDPSTVFHQAAAAATATATATMTQAPPSLSPLSQATVERTRTVGSSISQSRATDLFGDHSNYADFETYLNTSGDASRSMSPSYSPLENASATDVSRPSYLSVAARGLNAAESHSSIYGASDDEIAPIWEHPRRALLLIQLHEAEIATQSTRISASNEDRYREHLTHVDSANGPSWRSRRDNALRDTSNVSVDDLEELIMRQLRPRALNVLVGEMSGSDSPSLSIETVMERLRRQLRESSTQQYHNGSDDRTVNRRRSAGLSSGLLSSPQMLPTRRIQRSIYGSDSETAAVAARATNNIRTARTAWSLINQTASSSSSISAAPTASARHGAASDTNTPRNDSAAQNMTEAERASTILGPNTTAQHSYRASDQQQQQQQSTSNSLGSITPASLLATSVEGPLSTTELGERYFHAMRQLSQPTDRDATMPIPMGSSMASSSGSSILADTFLRWNMIRRAQTAVMASNTRSLLNAATGPTLSSSRSSPPEPSIVSAYSLRRSQIPLDTNAASVGRFPRITRLQLQSSSLTQPGGSVIPTNTTTATMASPPTVTHQESSIPTLSTRSLRTMQRLGATAASRTNPIEALAISLQEISSRLAQTASASASASAAAAASPSPLSGSDEEPH